ncbi:MAG: hypothetical protein MI892_06975 [Desulfobacterales bacterium]|nr:hypothetical protein [Desulfobacterales bacterium]
MTVIGWWKSADSNRPAAQANFTAAGGLTYVVLVITLVYPKKRLPYFSIKNTPDAFFLGQTSWYLYLINLL